MSEETTLLGLPTELRLRIYDFCIHLDPLCVVLKDIQHTTSSNGTRAVLLPNPGLKLHRHVPWLNLRLTCRFIAAELESYISDAAFLKQRSNRTYELDLDVYCNDRPIKSNRLVIWRSLPCPPEKAQFLVINVAAKRGAGPWTEGGAASLARALYQLLNHLFHKGPRLAGAKLERHMRIRELIINVDLGTERSPPELGCNTQPLYNWRGFLSGWEQVSKTGYLVNYLEKTKLCSRGESNSEAEIVVEYKTVPMIPGFWRGYGFEWGV